jgi:uncharacterized membrane protein YheB (UPF0754 family)
MNETFSEMNPALAALPKEVFVHAAEQKDQCWSSQQYRDEHHRSQHNTTTNRGAQESIDLELAEKLRFSKYNMHTTIISEFSNAAHREKVFTNPKFSAC